MAAVRLPVQVAGDQRLVVAGDLAVQLIQGVLERLLACLQTLTLREQQLAAGGDGVVPLQGQAHIVGQTFHRQPGGAHTAGQLDPAAVVGGIVPPAAGGAPHRRQNAHPFIIPQRIGRKAVPPAHLCNGHDAALLCRKKAKTACPCLLGGRGEKIG